MKCILRDNQETQKSILTWNSSVLLGRGWFEQKSSTLKIICIISPKGRSYRPLNAKTCPFHKSFLIEFHWVEMFWMMNGLSGNHIFYWIYYSVLYTTVSEGGSCCQTWSEQRKKLYKSIKNYSLQIAISKDKLLTLLKVGENNMWEMRWESERG